MISKVLAAIIFAVFALAAAVILSVSAPFATAQTAGSPDAQKPQLDYEFFKTRVEPIFLKKRSDEHARCYVCHQVMRHGGGPLSLDMLPPGANFWTEEQSRHNFEVVSKLVVPGDPSLSLFSANAAGAGSGRPRGHPPGREAICFRGRPGLEEYEGLGSRAKSRNFLHAVAERVPI